MRKLLRSIFGKKTITQLGKWRKDSTLMPLEEGESEMIKRRRFYASFVRPGDICFDVGANVGNRIDALLSAGGNVVAVEPQENCYRILKQIYGTKIKIVAKGLGEMESTKDFYVSNADTLSTFSEEFVEIVKDGRFKNYNWNTPIKVDVTTLDNLIAEYGQPSFIKIDVEGYELEVLKGLSSAVKMISFEYMVPEQIDKVVACLDQIEKNSSDIECNFSIGESMKFASDQWLSVSEMKQIVTSGNFIETEFGDIYCRLKTAHSSIEEADKDL